MGTKQVKGIEEIAMGEREVENTHLDRFVVEVSSHIQKEIVSTSEVEYGRSAVIKIDLEGVHLMDDLQLDVGDSFICVTFSSNGDTNHVNVFLPFVADRVHTKASYKKKTNLLTVSVFAK